MTDDRVVRDLALPTELRDRRSIRDFVIGVWLNEEPGRRYRYNVATLHDERRVYLLRPARLNKGCDFQIWVESWCGGKDKRPSHDDIRDHLHRHVEGGVTPGELLRRWVTLVYECTPPQIVLQEPSVAGVRAPQGLEPVDSLLHAIRWLFIEQDVTFWSGRGRAQPFAHYLEGLGV